MYFYSEKSFIISLQFRATYHPINFLEKKLFSLFPNIESILCLYKFENNLYGRMNGDALRLTDYDKVTIQKLRNKHTNYSWMRVSEIPWFNEENNSIQLSMDDEKYNQLLVLNFTSDEDKLKDIIAIQFPVNSKFFGLQKNINSLTTDEKQIIGEMMFQLLNAEYNEILEEKNHLIQLNKFYNLKNTDSIANVNFQRFFKEFCYSILEELADFQNKTFSISSETLEYIATHYTSHDLIKNILTQAYNLASMTNLFSNNVQITTLHVQSISELPTKNNKTDIQEQKIISLLNRYEEAAQLVYRKGETINGKSVAANLSPAISPPALTDAIKKHINEIDMLLQKYPYEWKLIRTSLKPLKELDEIYSDSKIIRLNG